MKEIELIKSFFNEFSLKTPKHFYWVYKGGSRYYVDKDANIRVGITSFLSRILPTHYALTKWRDDMGKDEAQRIFVERAKYGTIFHVLAANVLKNYKATGKYNVPILIYQIEQKVIELLPSHDCKPFIFELQKDMASLAKFCEQYKPDPILLETPLGSKDMALAATLDFFGTIQIPVKGDYGEVYKSGANKGLPKETTQMQRTLADIDFKTMIKKDTNEGANKPIGASAVWQLNYQKLFLTDNYPEYLGQEIKLYNAVPKNWKTNPEMQLTEAEQIPVQDLKGLYSASKFIDPYIIEKCGQSKIVEYLEYNGTIEESINVIDFQTYCTNLIKNFTK